MDFSRYLTDEKAEEQGVWQPLPDGAKARIARLNNKNFKTAFRAKSKANRAILDQDDETSDNLMESIVIELMAKHVLLDLQGVGIPDLDIFPEEYRGKTVGTDIPYSPKIGLVLMNASKDFAQKIRAYADAAENYALSVEEEAVKN